jgi:hypothetical protein
MWQFIRASAAAVVGAYRGMPMPEATAYLLGGVRGLVGLIGTPKVRDLQVFADRAIKCPNCPLYNQEYKTCGTPGQMDRWGNTVGCWCFLPLVSKYERKSCWLVETKDARAEKHGWVS